MPATPFFARNEGTLDRAIRVLLGVGLLYLAFTGRTVLGYLGFVPLITGLMGSCPLYSVLGIRTCPLQR